MNQAGYRLKQIYLPLPHERWHQRRESSHSLTLILTRGEAAVVQRVGGVFIPEFPSGSLDFCFTSTISPSLYQQDFPGPL